MTKLKTIDVQLEYGKNKQLKHEDVKALQQWADRQPHLPKLSELQLILFLQSCHFSGEATKTTIDTFYTVKAHAPELFADRDPHGPRSKVRMEVGLFWPLPKPTHENYRVIYCQIVDGDPGKFIFSEQIKSFDMRMMVWLMEEGTMDGLIILFNMENIVFGHLTKLGVLTVKKLLFYLQDALPVRLCGLHFLNVVPFMDKILALMRPFMKKELMDVLHLHGAPGESLYKFIPKECLPKDLGGTADSRSELHEQMKQTFMENADFFKEEEAQIADEAKRPGKPKNAGDIFGVEGSFKKLEID